MKRLKAGRVSQKNAILFIGFPAVGIYGSDKELWSVAPILVTKHTMGNIVLCPMILRFQESRRFQNVSSCRAQVPSSPIGSFGVGGYAKPDLVRHVYLKQHRTGIY